MASTNKTPEYELSQFIATDKPAWLSDYNGDMLKIDTGIAEAKAVADAASATAGNVSSVANNALDAAQAADAKADALVTTVNAVDDKAEAALDASSAASSAATQAASDAAAASAAASAAQTAADNAMTRANSAYSLANSKQNQLTFDSAPTAGSANPVTSGGVYNALQNVTPGGGGVSVAVGGITVKQGDFTLDSLNASGGYFGVSVPGGAGGKGYLVNFAYFRNPSGATTGEDTTISVTGVSGDVLEPLLCHAAVTVSNGILSGITFSQSGNVLTITVPGSSSSGVVTGQAVLYCN